MQNRVEIENIDEMRRQQGIDDVELRDEIRKLVVGDLVRLTFLIGTKEFSGETLPVRITSIRGYSFRGKLAANPVAPGASNLKLGSTIVFSTAHIHSLPKDTAPNCDT
jgi:hypothetical protein